MSDPIIYPRMGSTKKAAELYGVTPNYIRLLCKRGKVRYVLHGRSILVNLDSLARYFEQGDSPEDSTQTVHGVRRVAR